MRSTILAQRIALGVPLALLGGAYLSQYGFGLHPCEMCWWQRYPHFAALALALLAFAVARPRFWVALAGIAILASGLIGGFHAGVEYGWWQGITGCATPFSGGGGNMLGCLIPLVASDKNIKLWNYNPLGLQYTMRFNHTQPPFDNPKVRQAVTYALNQKTTLVSLLGIGLTPDAPDFTLALKVPYML